MAAGLDAGLVEPDTTYIDKGSVVEAGYEIKNSDEKSHGEQTMTQVIEKSLNTGVIFVQEKVGKDLFLKYVKQFGFGEKTGIDLPNESPGNINNLYTDRKIEFYTASFGQGITVTPLQLAAAYAAIANGGELLRPQIIDKVIRKGEEGEEKEIKISKKEIKRKVISRQTAQKLALMLQSNVENGMANWLACQAIQLPERLALPKWQIKKRAVIWKALPWAPLLVLAQLKIPFLLWWW